MTRETLIRAADAIEDLMIEAGICRKIRVLDNGGSGEMKETLCFSCDHADKGDKSICPWAKEFKPVEGWDATKRVLFFWIHNRKKPIESYKVINCPIYRKSKEKRR